MKVKLLDRRPGWAVDAQAMSHDAAYAPRAAVESGTAPASRLALAEHALAVGGVAAGGALIGWLVLLHLRMVLSPAPQEMREGAVVWITRLLLEGHNPYALAELPAATNVYGIFFHLVVLPVAALFGNGFQVHRAVSAVAILGACALLYRLLRREGTDPILAFVGTALFYASSLYFVAPLARPDGVGLLLSLASVSFLFREKVTPVAFATGMSAAVLAVLTKSYFAYPPFVLAAYTFLYRSRSLGLAYALLGTVSALATLAALAAVAPAYINVSFLLNMQSASYDLRHLARQTTDWLIFSLPLTAALAVAVWRLAAGDRQRRPTLPAFGAIANAGVFALWLGGHDGAHMTYLFQLVSPMLTLALLPSIGSGGWPRAIVTAALPVALVVNSAYFPWTFGRFAAAERTFARLQATIDGHRQVTGSTEIAGLLALGGRPVFDSGQSEYFGEASINMYAPGVTPASAIAVRWDAFTTEIADGIRAGAFDLIVRNRREWGLIPLDLVLDWYEIDGSLDLDFAWSGQHWPVDLWCPRPRPD